MNIHSALAVRTDFSLGESVIDIDRLATAVKDLDLKVVGITETMTISSLINVSKKLGECKTIFGVRLNVVDDPTLREKKAVQNPIFPKLYARNEAGLKVLMKLLSRGFDSDRFYYMPRLHLSDVCQALKEGAENLILSTGDVGSIYTHPDYIAVEALLMNSAELPFIELPIGKCPAFDQICKRAIEATSRYSHARVIATKPSLWYGDEKAAFAANMSIAMKRPAGFADPRESFSIVSAQDFAREVVAKVDLWEKSIGIPRTITSHLAKRALFGTSELADLISYKWSALEPCLPKLADDPQQELVRLCKEGWAKRFNAPVFGHVPTRSEQVGKYVPRLKHELAVIEKMGFANYFLVVADLTKWCKTNGVLVGPGRGSVGGSLIAYLMGITDVDPIRFDLLFERFINPDRIDLPDIDLDFMSTRRDEVIAYLVSTYKDENVAGISNYGTLGSKSALRDVARIVGLSPEQSSVSKLIPSVHGQPVSLEEACEQVAELQTFKKAHPAAWDIATKLEGKMRSYGQHAAGVVVAGEPIVNRAVVERRDGRATINWDKRSVEEMGLIKLDILGLSTLDILATALRTIRTRHRTVPNLNEIPLDDEKTLAIFSEGATTGIFQFEGGSAKQILKNMAGGGILTFDDIVAATSLNRPGPLDAGLVEKYVNGRTGMGLEPLEHPNMGPSLEGTFNTIVYQEQVMRISRDLCGYTLAEADTLRKIMGKKDPEKMKLQREKFVDGAFNTSGCEKVIAEALFEKIEKFAGYAFNKSHAVEYSLISYQSAYLKAHYPIEFYAATLSVMKEEKLAPITKEMRERGFKVAPPDVNVSTNEFEVLNDTILCAPFSSVKNVSINGVAAILKLRKEGGRFDSLEDFRNRVKEAKVGRYINSRSIGHLEAVGAFARIEQGVPPALDPSRRKDQVKLMPGVLDIDVPADRAIPDDRITRNTIEDMVQDMRQAISGVLPSPYFGLNARMMVVSDAPTSGEEQEGMLAHGYSFSYASEALARAGLTREDAYWTAMVKRPKAQGEKMFSPDVINEYLPYIDKEVETLKPPVIVCLGSTAARHFVKSIKGNVLDAAGSVVFVEDIDAFVVIGFNPQSIYFDPDKQAVLNEVFEKAASLLAQ